MADAVFEALRTEFAAKISSAEWDQIAAPLGLEHHGVVHPNEQPYQRHLRLAETIRLYLEFKDRLLRRFPTHLVTEKQWLAMEGDVELALLVRAHPSADAESLWNEARRAVDAHVALQALESKAHGGSA